MLPRWKHASEKPLADYIPASRHHVPIGEDAGFTSLAEQPCSSDGRISISGSEHQGMTAETTSEPRDRVKRYIGSSAGCTEKKTLTIFGGFRNRIKLIKETENVANSRISFLIKLHKNI